MHKLFTERNETYVEKARYITSIKTRNFFTYIIYKHSITAGTPFLRIDGGKYLS